MEREVVENQLKNGNLVAYTRYVDDIVKKSETSNKLAAMNQYEKNLNFTLEKMTDNGLNFLDTTTYLDSPNIPQLKQYRKPTASDVIFNFNNNICPKKYKISTLTGEIHRANNTCTTSYDLETALKTVQTLFLKNGYPNKMITRKINEIKKSKFQPSDKKQEREEEAQKFPERHFNFCIPFTSPRCDKVGQKMQKIIKYYTPLYTVNYGWKTLKLSKLFSPKLKHSIPDLEKCGVVYEFKCYCQLSYIGETQQQFCKRIQEHNQPCRKTAIFNHIDSCDTYKTALTAELGSKPTPKEKINFITKQFVAKSTGLTNYHERKTQEAIFIRLEKPALNAQVAHKNISLI